MATSTAHQAFSSSSFPSSSSKPWMYEVFLSFRGEDTRNNFTVHLYMALKDAGINVFIDVNELRRGEGITAELVQAIQGSRISVIVFSKRYADSSWCLEELVKIMECKRTLRQTVLPIFYDVDPSDVRKQSGSFAEAFEKHEERFVLDMDKVVRWKAALVEAANLSGWDLRKTADGHEARLIRKIIDEISIQLNNTYLFVADYPVGINSRVQDMSCYLDVGSNYVRMVGIWGMGGLGKTTIAKAIYNQFCQSFEGKSFLANVRETIKQPNGQVCLQEQLLSDILKPTNDIKVGSVDVGINVIKDKLQRRRVLVIIDDIDQVEQVKAIARNHDWFGEGSRIIVTTRDEHLLKQLEVDAIYPVQAINKEEALEFFSWNAFRSSYPSNDHLELSKSVVAYCGGLPLALQVLGCFLFGRTITEWKSALKKLERIPDHVRIQEHLHISFDGLSKDAKDIFLDISCFFIGVDKNYVIQILDGCGFSAEIGISVLFQRCFVTLSERNKLMMHDLLRDMGREIVRRKSPDDPGNCSRLWHHEDVTDVLTDKSGSKRIEGLILNLPRSKNTSFNTKAFKKMKRLRLLQLNYVQLTGSYNYLSKKLRWLCWHGFPLKFIPNDFHQQNIVAIDLQYSCLTHVWRNPGLLEKLKILNLSHSHYLTQSPDFLKLPNLEQLILKDCKSLSEVDESIGDLERLALVNLEDCKMLKDLPKSFYKLKSIETLVLVGCSRFENLGDQDLGKMVSLTTLLADNTAIRTIPASIVRLKNLKSLSLCGLKGSPSSSLPSPFWSWTLLLPPSLQGLHALRELYLKDCNLVDDAIPKDLGSLPSLKLLDLDGNYFRSLPSLSGLSKLESLSFNCCANLRAIPDLPTSLTELDANHCTELKRMPDFSQMLNMRMLLLNHSPKLVEFPGLDKSSLKSMRSIGMSGCTNIPATVKESIIKGWTASGYGGIYLPGNDVPECYTFINEGDLVYFKVPQVIGCKIKALTLCITYSCSPYDRNPNLISIFVVNHTKLTKFLVQPASTFARSPNEVIWQGQLLNNEFNLEDGDSVEVSIRVASNFMVTKTGVSLVRDKFFNGDSCNCVPYDYFDIDEDEDKLQIKWNTSDTDNDEAGPSHYSSDEDRPPKRLRPSQVDCLLLNNLHNPS